MARKASRRRTKKSRPQTLRHRSPGKKTELPVYTPDLMVTIGVRVIDSKGAGAVALTGRNLGKERFRRKRCYLGLFQVPWRKG